MTKQEAYDYFYKGLTDEEKAGGPEGLPDFVEVLPHPREHGRISGKDLEWAKKVAEDFFRRCENE